MAGTIIGGLNARDTNYKRYGRGFYSRIGKLGGAKSKGGGFGNGEKGRELARWAGAKGGRKSRRGPSKETIWLNSPN